MKPIIGIPLNAQHVKRNVSSKDIYYINEEYTLVLNKLGAMPILLPFTDDISLVKAQVDLCDGILLSGGDDITPYLYGEEPNPKLGEYNEAIDRYQLNMTNETIQQNKPLLGICRGAQIINIIFGGSVYTDMSYVPEKTLLHMQTGKRRDVCHTMVTKKGTKMHQYFGDEILINSFHHQAISTIGTGLIVSATAKDNIVEAIENNDLKYCVGVQWHPEIMAIYSESMNNLFIDFINHCKK
ncbi:MAG: hypothetical protein BEN19_03865 [Epulopiscium sp. Nuni2H_MBin003]|nr:MAG: hypothetical protein BEN19_03865 [Epulopiscium sp. Nuni2H_MBin003]